METYSYELVKRLSFPRFGGTENELAAARLLCKEIERLGGEAALEDFAIPAYKIDHCLVKVKAPYEKELDALPFGLSGSLPMGGADMKFIYGSDGSADALYGMDDLSGCAVLIDELKLDAYKLLCERGVGAILVVCGKWYDSQENSELLQRHLRPPYLAIGKRPTFFIRAGDAIELVKNGAECLHIELDQQELEGCSRNVVATVKGNELSHESVIITAHYDSVTAGIGSWDNATGTATAMYIYRHFHANPPKRTLRFVFCGSEEQGLCGSKAYIAAHPELIENEIKFGFNFDMCGTALGMNKICVTGNEALKHYAEAFCREYGLYASVYLDVRSSDSAPIADKGIPTLDLMRVSKTAEIHTRNDRLTPISGKQLEKDGDFAIAFIERVANAARLPAELGMPDGMKEKLDKYFQRQKPEEGR